MCGRGQGGPQSSRLGFSLSLPLRGLQSPARGPRRGNGKPRSPCEPGKSQGRGGGLRAHQTRMRTHPGGPSRGGTEAAWHLALGLSVTGDKRRGPAGGGLGGGCQTRRGPSWTLSLTLPKRSPGLSGRGRGGGRRGRPTLALAAGPPWGRSGRPSGRPRAPCADSCAPATALHRPGAGGGLRVPVPCRGPGCRHPRLIAAPAPPSLHFKGDPRPKAGPAPTFAQRRERQLGPVLGEGVAEALPQAAQVGQAAVQVEHAAVRPLGADLEELLLVAAPADDEPADAVHPAAPHEHVNERRALKHRRGHAAGRACPGRQGARPPGPGSAGSPSGAGVSVRGRGPSEVCPESDRSRICPEPTLVGGLPGAGVCPESGGVCPGSARPPRALRDGAAKSRGAGRAAAYKALPFAGGAVADVEAAAASAFPASGREDAPSGGGGGLASTPRAASRARAAGAAGTPGRLEGRKPGRRPRPARPLLPLRAPSRRPGPDETGQGGRAPGETSLFPFLDPRKLSGRGAARPTRPAGVEAARVPGGGRGRGAPAPGTRRRCCRPGSRLRAARPSTLGRAGGRSRPPRVPRAFQSRHRPATARTRLGRDGDAAGQTTRQARASQPQGPPKRRVDPLLRSGTGRRWERVPSERASPRELGAW